MTELQRRRVGTVSWRVVVWILLAVAGWDLLGLLAGGNTLWAGQSYDVLRQIPGGMRTYGDMLLVILGVTLVAYGRWSMGHSAPLRLCLAVLAGWYTGWAVGIAWSWVVHGRVLSWGNVGKVTAIAVLFVVVARATPRQARR